MSQVPNYASTPQSDGVLVSTANTNRDGTGTIVDVRTAGASGSRVDALVIQALGTTTAGMIRLFIYDGATYRLFKEVPVQAITPSGTIPAWRAVVSASAGDLEFPVVLKATRKLGASTNNAESFVITPVNSGDF